MTELTDEQLLNLWGGDFGIEFRVRDFARAAIAADRQLRQGDASLPIFAFELKNPDPDGFNVFTYPNCFIPREKWERTPLVKLSDAMFWCICRRNHPDPLA